MKSFFCLLFAAAMSVSIAGCGNQDFDGVYSAKEGFGLLMVLTVKGDQSVIRVVNLLSKKVVREQEFLPEYKGDKILLTNASSRKTFAFVRAVDEKGLKCLNCGFGTGLPNNWDFYQETE